MISNSEIILTPLKMSAIIYLGLEHTLTLIPNQLYISQFRYSNECFYRS